MKLNDKVYDILKWVGAARRVEVTPCLTNSYECLLNRQSDLFSRHLLTPSHGND